MPKSTPSRSAVAARGTRASGRQHGQPHFHAAQCPPTPATSWISSGEPSRHGRAVRQTQLRLRSRYRAQPTLAPARSAPLGHEEPAYVSSDSQRALMSACLWLACHQASTPKKELPAVPAAGRRRGTRFDPAGLARRSALAAAVLCANRRAFVRDHRHAGAGARTVHDLRAKPEVIRWEAQA